MLWAGIRGVLTLAAISGLADIDAITLSLARMARADLNPSIASHGVLLAIAVNTATQTTLAWGTGGRGRGRLVFLSAFAALASGTLGILITRAYLSSTFGN